jgi:O-antigen ligase
MMGLLMRLFIRWVACFALGLVVALLVLVGLMFCGQFDLIKGLQLTGQPLAQLSLLIVPEAFWNDLTGLANATQSHAVQSFLSLCTALGQIGLLLAVGFFRLWYVR